MRGLVILPTYNEAENIVEVIRRIRGAMPELDVLVADDNSPDGTAGLAEQIGTEVGGVHLLRRPGKEGLGPAYRAGFHWALEHDYEVIVQMDADLSHDPAVLPELVGAIEAGADYSVGSRYVEGGDIPDWPWHRRALSRWGNRYARWMLDLPAHDATSGFRGLKADLLRRVDFDAVRADGYGFQIELLYRFDHAGTKGAEVPIVFRDRTRGKSKMSSRIIVEALVLVTIWGLRDRWRQRRRQRRATA